MKSLYDFVHSRIAAGRMHEAALSRVNRAIRTLSAHHRLAMCEATIARCLRSNTNANGLRLYRPGCPVVGDEVQRTGRLTASPIHFRDASAFTNIRHRHHAAPVGHFFSGGVFDGDILCATVITGRPVARVLNDGRTIEVLRTTSDGTRNACSKALGWAIKVSKAKGFETMITYTLPHESGASLRAVGFVEDGMTKGGTWDRQYRPRVDRHPTGPKRRWRLSLVKSPAAPAHPVGASSPL